MSIRVEDDAGDDWTEVVDLHDATLRRFIARQTPDRGLVDDILQDTYLRAVRSGRHPRRAELTDEGWLRMLARRASVDAYRGAKRRAAPVDYLTMVGEPAAADTALTPGSDEHLDALASREAVRWAFRRLSPRQQRLLVLRGVEELTYQEMALAEGTSVEAMASALNRARERLRAGIQSYESRGLRGLPALFPVAFGALRRLRERVARAQAVVSPHVVELAGATMALGVAGVLAAGAGHSAAAVPVGVAFEAGTAVVHTDVAASRTTEPALGAPAAAVDPSSVASPPERARPAPEPPRALVSARPDVLLKHDQTWMHVGFETTVQGTSRTEVTVAWDCSRSTLVTKACSVLGQVPGVKSGPGS